MNSTRTRRLTPLQQTTLDWIGDYIVNRGKSPTMREIGAEYNISPKAAWERVQAIVRKGHLISDPGRSRTLRRPDTAPRCLMCGQVIYSRDTDMLNATIKGEI